MAVAIKQPGWYRGAIGTLIGAAFGFGLVIALRAISGLDVFQTEQTGYPHVIVPLVTAPLGFLLGFGAFDYWFRWAAGKPTVPDDHKDHGATRWQDYFKFNTDHKVIGIQYVVTTLVFFMIGGIPCPADPGRTGPAGDPDPRRQLLQRPLLDPCRS